MKQENDQCPDCTYNKLNKLQLADVSLFIFKTSN